MNDVDLMRVALQEAAAGVEEGGSPFGAVIARDGEVVARGRNEVLQTNDPTRHAEVNAVSAASAALGRFDLSDCVCYSTCEPCPMCFSALHWARIRRIVFGIRTEQAASYGFNELRISDEDLARLAGLSVELRGGVLADEVLALFESWRARPDARTY